MAHKHKAVFLDRDGVINFEHLPYQYLPEHFKLNEGLFDTLKVFMQRGYKMIVITNQGGIAKGIYTEKEVLKLHDLFCTEAKNHGVEILDIYYCPHHDDFGKCLCRKPGSMMLEKAMAKYDIDAATSYFIGDSARDVEAGRAAGLNTIKIVSNQSLKDTVDLIST